MSWNQGLFNCCGNLCNCAFAHFCACWSLGKVADHVGDSCCLCAGLSFVALPCLICMERGKMRAKYGIEGGSIGDALVGFFCPCCGLAQMLDQMEGGSMAKDDTVITSQPQGQDYHSQDQTYQGEKLYQGEDTSVVSQQP